MCFSTVVGPAQCSADHSIANSGNALTVGGSVSDAPDGNDSGDAVFFEPADPNVACRADLSITKSAAAPIVSPGGQLSYTVVVQNHGPDAASGVQVSDPIPAGLTVTSAQPSQGSCTVAGTITCSLGTLAAGGSAQILVSANLAASASGSVTNCAVASANQGDPNRGNNSSCATTTIVTPTPPPAEPVDLQIVKHVNHGVAKFGQVLTYTLDVKNNGPGTVPDAIVTDTSALPLHPLSIKPSQGSCSSKVPFKCNLGTLAAGATATITIRAIPRQTGTEINSVTIEPGCLSAANCPPGGPPRDTNPSNNTSHAKTTVHPYLTLVKTVSKRVVNAGQKVSYRLKVANPTPVALKNVRVCDRLPLGLVFVSSNPRARLRNGSYCWTFKSLGAHRSATIKLIARVLQGASRSLVNHAIATAPGVPSARAHRRLRVIPPPPPPAPVTG